MMFRAPGAPGGCRTQASTLIERPGDFEDKLGGTRTQRPGLDNALSHAREGDALVVWKLDRLGRSVKGLVDLVAELEQRQVHFRSLTDEIDTTTPTGRFFFRVMASLAQMERELIAERTQAGLVAARKVGRVGGRKRRMMDSKIAVARQLLERGATPKDVAHDLGVSVPTLYRWLPASARTPRDGEPSSPSNSSADNQSCSKVVTTHPIDAPEGS